LPYALMCSAGAPSESSATRKLARNGVRVNCPAPTTGGVPHVLDADFVGTREDSPPLVKVYSLGECVLRISGSSTNRRSFEGFRIQDEMRSVEVIVRVPTVERGRDVIPQRAIFAIRTTGVFPCVRS
jgi:hypothetical protein